MLALITQVLTYLGALLGIVAFVQNILKPLASGNKERWRRLRGILTEQDLDVMARSMSERQVLDDKLLTRLKAFARGIELDAECVKFRGPFAGMIRRSLSRTLELYRRWIGVVNVPWFTSEVAGFRHGKKTWYVDAKTLEMALSVSNKQSQPPDVGAAAGRFGQEASCLLTEMRRQLQRVYQLANREVIEYLLPWNWPGPYAVASGLAVLALILTTGWLSSEVATSSSAPGVLSGRRFVYCTAAYDCRVPFARFSLFRWGSPRRGDLVVVSLAPRQGECGMLVRVAGVPGDTIEIDDDIVRLNGRVLEYEPVDRRGYDYLPVDNDIGAVVALEKGLGANHLVTYSPGITGRRAQRVEPGSYYVLADNRNRGLDSREVGAIRRVEIAGKYLCTLP